MLRLVDVCSAYSMEANQGQEEYEEVQTDLRKKDEEVSN